MPPNAKARFLSSGVIVVIPKLPKYFIALSTLSRARVSIAAILCEYIKASLTVVVSGLLVPKFLGL